MAQCTALTLIADAYLVYRKFAHRLTLARVFEDARFCDLRGWTIVLETSTTASASTESSASSATSTTTKTSSATSEASSSSTAPLHMLVMSRRLETKARLCTSCLGSCKLESAGVNSLNQTPLVNEYRTALFRNQPDQLPCMRKRLRWFQSSLYG